MLKKIPKIKSDYSTSVRLKRSVFLFLPTKASVFLFKKLVADNQERNSLEAAKFLVDTNNIYPTGFYFLIGKFLRFSLALGGVKLPKPYVSEVIDSLKETRRDPSRRRAACDQILNTTSKLSPRQTSAHGWKLISLALSGLGFIRAGTVARNHCFAATLLEVSSGSASNRTTNLAIKGLLETRRFAEARQLIKSHAESLDSPITDQTYSDYLASLRQIRPEVKDRDAKLESEVEKLFISLVTGKSIALVAPGVIDKEYGHEIDSHDTVFRVKFNGLSFMLDEKFVGRRCDVTSHNSDLFALAKLDKDTEKRIALEAPDLKLLISKRDLSIALGSIPVKQMRSWPPTFLTTGTSGTLALFEIVRCSPSKVKLFGFDFYTNRQRYNTNLLKLYQSLDFTKANSRLANSFNFEQGQLGSTQISSELIGHDLKSDFLLIKNLYELSGLIDGTPEVLEILNLTADEYDMRLEEMLGDW